MAYVPPHKRHLKDGDASSPPTPELPPETLIPRFQRDVNSTSKFYYPYAYKAISRWFVVGLADQSKVSDVARLKPAATHSFELEYGQTPLDLVLKENVEASEFSANPWVFVTESVKQDLLSSFQLVKDEMRRDEFGEIKPRLVVRFGRIRFHGNRWSTAESINTLKKWRKSLYTSIPPSFMEHITSNIGPKTGFEFEEEKELYYLTFTDTKGPGVICKCYFAKDTNQLEPYKSELNQVAEHLITRERHLITRERHLIADMFCLQKNLDMRLMLYTKRPSENLLLGSSSEFSSSSDEGTDDMTILINSAILDSEVKGGLRWPLGKRSSGTVTVVKVWHTNARTFKNSSMRIKVRHADRFDFRSSQGEVAEEVFLKMPGIVSLLGEQTDNTDAALEMLQEDMKMIWMHFLS